MANEKYLLTEDEYKAWKEMMLSISDEQKLALAKTIGALIHSAENDMIKNVAIFGICAGIGGVGGYFLMKKFKKED